MNYRQWKKEFKKRNGRNPKIVEDKRQFRRLLVKLPAAFAKIDTEKIIRKMVRNVKTVLDKYAETFQIFAEEYKRTIDYINRIEEGEEEHGKDNC